VIIVKILIDTNVFNNKRFCNWLLNSEKQKYLPSIAYMEFLYHQIKKGNTESMVNTFLKEMNVKIVPFGKNEAKKAVANALGNWDFSENARDYAIGGTALSLNAKLITNNKKHFKWMKNVITPEEFLKQDKETSTDQPSH